MTSRSVRAAAVALVLALADAGTGGAGPGVRRPGHRGARRAPRPVRAGARPGRGTTPRSRRSSTSAWSTSATWSRSPRSRSPGRRPPSGREWTLRLRRGSGVPRRDRDRVGRCGPLPAAVPALAVRGRAAGWPRGSRAAPRTGTGPPRIWPDSRPAIRSPSSCGCASRRWPPSRTSPRPAAAITSARGAGAGPFVPTTASPIRGRAAFVPFGGHVRGRPFLDGLTLRAADSARRSGRRHPRGRDRAAGGVAAARPRPRASRLLARRIAAGRRRRRSTATTSSATSSPAVRRPRRRSRRCSCPRCPRRDPPPGGGPSRDRSCSRSAAMFPPWSASAWSPTWARPASRPPRWRRRRTPSGRPRPPRASSPGHRRSRIRCWPSRSWPASSARRDATTLARAALESDPDRREALLHKAEAALRSQSIVVPLAALPLGYRARPGVHGIAVDAGGRIRLEDAWVEP